MIKKFLALFVIIFSFYAHAQYTEIINSNRPGLSESPYSVGKGVYQFEGNLFYKKTSVNPPLTNTEALGLQLHFRTTFFLERLELNLTTALEKDQVVYSDVFDRYEGQFGLGELTLAAKYLVFIPKYADKGKEIRSWRARHSFDFRRWIPHIGVYAGANFGSILNNYHERGGITPKVGILLQNEFSNQFNFISNVYYNYIGSDYPEWSYILTATQAFNQRFSGFLEHQGVFDRGYTAGNEYNFGIGAAYLFNENLQINAAARASFQNETTGYGFNAGVSYRFDRHHDKFTELDKYGNKIEPPKSKSYNKGFFGRIFDGIGSIFKKREKSTVEFKNDKPKKDNEESTETKEVDVNPNNTKKRPKSILDDIIKSDKKLKKKKTKKEEKAEKKAKKEAEKTERKKIKEEEKLKRKQEKEAEKLKKELEKEEKLRKLEEEKLKKEIQELEEDLKKEEKKDDE